MLNIPLEPMRSTPRPPFRTPPAKSAFSTPSGRGVEITGYAATFNLADSQSDVFRPGAFRAPLAQRAHRLPLLWQHDLAEPMGRLLDAREDAQGLWFRARLASTRRAADAAALIGNGALRECSIGFFPRRVRFEERNGQRCG